MGALLSKFWKLCLWLEGGEGIGLEEETQHLEGIYSRVREEGVVDILKERLKLKGAEDVERLKKAVSGETTLVVKHKEAGQGELFNPVWDILYVHGKHQDRWLLSLPKDPITLATAKHFTVPKSSTLEEALVVARSDTFDKILIWTEGTPGGSLRREFHFEGDRVTLTTNACQTEAESVEVRIHFIKKTSKDLKQVFERASSA